MVCRRAMLIAAALVSMTRVALADHPTTDPVVPALSSVFHLSLQNGFLLVSTDVRPGDVDGPPSIARAPDGEPAAVRVTQLAGPNGMGDGMKRFQLDIPPNFADAPQHVQVLSGANQLNISRDLEDNTTLPTVQYVQNLPLAPQAVMPSDLPVKLYVKSSGDAAGHPAFDLHLQAYDFATLRKQFPIETGRYLLPLLGQIGQEAAVCAPAPNLAWQVLSDRSAGDPAIDRQVAVLAAKLDAQDLATRDAASEALRQLKSSAVPALQAFDRSQLSPEQNSRIEAILAPYRPVPRDRADLLRHDGMFLCDCLYLDDATLRSAAITRLSVLLERNLPYDAGLAGDDRLNAVHAVRAIVMGVPLDATQPATAPDTAE